MDFADDNFKFDGKDTRFPKSVENTVGKGTISPFPTVFSKDLYCRNAKTRVCLGKDWYKNIHTQQKISIQVSLHSCEGWRGLVLFEDALSPFFTGHRSFIFYYFLYTHSILHCTRLFESCRKPFGKYCEKIRNGLWSAISSTSISFSQIQSKWFGLITYARKDALNLYYTISISNNHREKLPLQNCGQFCYTALFPKRFSSCSTFVSAEKHVWSLAYRIWQCGSMAFLLTHYQTTKF